jgi:hypothetical protein
MLPIALAMSGCSQTNYTPNTAVTPPPAAPASLIVVHASPDSPNLNVDVQDTNGNSQGLAPILDVGFGAATPVFQLPLGTYVLNVDELLPTGGGLTASPAATSPLLSGIGTDLTTANAQTVVFVAGSNAAISNLSVTAAYAASGNANVVIAYVAQAPGPYDVYVTSPTATIADSTPAVRGLNLLGTRTATVSLSAGSVPYRVRILDSFHTLIFDSGTANSLTFPSGGAVVLAILDNAQPGTGISPFILGEYSTSLSQTFVDASSTSTAKFVNAAPQLGFNVDAAVDGTVPLSAANIALDTAGAGCGLAAGTPTIDFFATGTSTALPELETIVTLLASNKTFIATGLGTSGAAGNSLSTLIFNNDARPRATEARVKFINAAPSALFGDGATYAVNLYISQAGTVADTDIQAGSVPPSAYAADANAGDGSIIPAAVPFGSEASFPDADYLNVDSEPADGSLYLQPYLELPAGSYDIRIAVTNTDGTTQTIVGEQDAVSFAAGNVVSIIATDPAPPSSTYGLINLDNVSCP